MEKLKKSLGDKVQYVNFFYSGHGLNVPKIVNGRWNEKSYEWALLLPLEEAQGPGSLGWIEEEKRIAKRHLREAAGFRRDGREEKADSYEQSAAYRMKQAREAVKRVEQGAW